MKSKIENSTLHDIKTEAKALDVVQRSKLLAEKLKASDKISTQVKSVDLEKKKEKLSTVSKDVHDFKKQLFVAKDTEDFNAHADKHVTVLRDYAHKDLTAYHTTTVKVNDVETQQTRANARKQIRDYLSSLKINDRFMNKQLINKYQSFGSSFGDCFRNPLMHEFSIEVDDIEAYEKHKVDIDAKLLKANKACIFYNINATARRPKYEFVYVRQLT